MFQFWLELVIVALWGLFIGAEIIYPLLQGLPMFPILRNRDVKKDIHDARLMKERRRLEKEHIDALKEINRKK